MLTKLGEGCLRVPASPAAIAEMQAASERELCEPVPGPYVLLLQISNGLQVQCANFKEAENLVPENLDYHRHEIIVLGNVGNMCWIVFDKRDRRYHLTGIGSPDYRLESFGTFEDMLLTVISDQGVI